MKRTPPCRHAVRAGLSGLAALALLTCRAPATAQTAAAPETKAVLQRMIVYERDGSDLLANLEYLSDMIGPRLTGSERLKKANDWTADKMRQYGLENVHLESYTIPRGWERGTVEARIVEPNGLPVAAAQMAWTPGTRGKVTGPVVVFAPESEADFAAFKGKLRGAIILASRDVGNPRPSEMMGWASAPALPPIPAFAVPAPVNRQAGPAPVPPDFRRFAALRKKTAEFLKQEGAAVILRDAGKPYDLLNMTGSWEADSKIPTLFVTHEHIAMLHRLLKRGQPVTMEIKSTARFVSGPLTVYNTVGEIKGTENPQEVVLLGGHLDSWDLGTGSTDNGTGAMAALEAARLLKAANVPLKRTVRFVLFSGEEEGLFGSRAYVEAHKADMNNFDVVFIHDTGTGRVKGAWLQNRAEDKPLLERQFALLTDLGLLTDAPNLLPGKMNGTDHASFDDAGVPAFAFNQDSADYGMTHHSQADTFDKVRPEDIKQGACVMAVLAYEAAQMPERYPRRAATSTDSTPK